MNEEKTKRPAAAAAATPVATRRRSGRQAAVPAAPPPAAGIAWPTILPEQQVRALALQFEFQQSEWWPEAKLLVHQLRQLQNVIRHAWRTVPFYRERLAAVAELPLGELLLLRHKRPF